MSWEPDTDGETTARMREAHAFARSAAGVRLDGDAEAWGWRGRTLGRPVHGAGGEAWLRVVCAPTAKAGGKLWEGPAQAQAHIPQTVPRPVLLGCWDQHFGCWSYRAEHYTRVRTPTVSATPHLTRAVDLPGAWWDGLRAALEQVGAVSTERVAVRQEYLDRALPRYLGAPVDTRAPAWSCAHGDLHWANLTAPGLTVLDWEGWGTAPAGYDAALLHAYSLAVPGTAARVRRELAGFLDSPAGRFAELAVIAELLQTTTRGDNLLLREPLRARAAHLLGRAVPAPHRW